VLVKSIKNSHKISLIYHDFFDYPLSLSELKKWDTSSSLKTKKSLGKVKKAQGFYYLAKKKEIVKKRLIRKKISAKKMKIAQKVVKHLIKIPSIKMVAVTGSLAMQNSNKDSDIDLMVITQKGTLWSSRAIVYCLFTIAYCLTHAPHFRLRKPKSREERDKLCFNIWMDEKDLKIKEKNIYTAHEIAQIIPLINKNKTYEKFIYKNNWIGNYWPNAVNLQDAKGNPQKASSSSFYLLFATILEPLSFWIQYQYMKPKITIEIVTKTRAFFHPYDWSSKVLKYLEEKGIYGEA
jgi:predicted nucleotidyltransferase